MKMGWRHNFLQRLLQPQILLLHPSDFVQTRCKHEHQRKAYCSTRAVYPLPVQDFKVLSLDNKRRVCIRVLPLPKTLGLFCKRDFLSGHFRRALDMSQITCKSGSNSQNDWLWRDFSRPYRACYVTLMHNQDWSLEGITVDLWYLRWCYTLVHIDPCMWCSYQGGKAPTSQGVITCRSS